MSVLFASVLPESVLPVSVLYLFVLYLPVLSVSVLLASVLPESVLPVSVLPVSVICIICVCIYLYHLWLCLCKLYHLFLYYREERKIRIWVDTVFVHLISPNVYRTMSESLDTFRWFSEAGDWETNFSTFQRMSIIYIGGFVMYFVGKKLRRKWVLGSTLNIFISCQYLQSYVCVQ